MRNRPLCSVCLILFLLICAAMYSGGEKAADWLYPTSLEGNIKEKMNIRLTGRVYKKESRESNQILYLKNNSIYHQNQILRESRIIVYDKEKEKICIGQKLIVEGELSFFEPAYNPGNFDQRRYYQRQGIRARIWNGHIETADEKRSVFFDTLYRFRERWISVFEKYMPEEDGAVLRAMLLGEKNGMDAELRELYQANGIGHVLAISGLHLSFLGIGMYKLIRKITGSYPVGGAFGILFLMLYILMIGFTVSAIRALVMFLFRVGADMTGRHYDAPTALSAAAVTVLVWRPLSLYDGGFWLSFGAVLAILAVVPVVQDVFSRTETASPAKACVMRRCEDSSLSVYFMGGWEYVGQMILQGLTASVGINLVILPILLYYFFEFPLYSFILNLFVIPLMSVLLFLGMAGSLFVLWLPLVSSFLFWVCGRILCFYQMSCKAALHLPGARLVIGRPEIWQIAVYYGILFLGLILLKYVAAMKGRNVRKEWSVVFLWAVGIMILTTRFGESGRLTTAVLDVGQGDGIFIKGPEGGAYLVDGGSSDVKKVGRYRLEPFLKSQGVGALDYVLISHGDSDHMNGVEELIERQDIGVKIRTLVLPVKEAWDEALTGLAEKAKDYGIRVAVIEPGQSIREGEMAVTCIQPGNMGIKSEDAGSRQENAVPETGSTVPVIVKLEPGNEASMVLAVQYGQFDMLLTGDVEGEGEKQLTKQLEESCSDCTWEILKVAHHGSKNSSAEEFLRLVRPVYAFVSAGQENRYGHPHQEAVERLADAGCKIYSTQENGAIIVEVEEGEMLRMEKWQR